METIIDEVKAALVEAREAKATVARVKAKIDELNAMSFIDLEPLEVKRSSLFADIALTGDDSCKSQIETLTLEIAAAEKTNKELSEMKKGVSAKMGEAESRYSTAVYKYNQVFAKYLIDMATALNSSYSTLSGGVVDCFIKIVAIDNLLKPMGLHFAVGAERDCICIPAFNLPPSDSASIRTVDGKFVKAEETRVRFGDYLLSGVDVLESDLRKQGLIE